MAVSANFFVIDPHRGPIAEEKFDGEADLAALLDRKNPAGIEISTDTGEVIIRDYLEYLFPGLCLGGGNALETGGTYEYASVAGYDMALIEADGDEARIECEGDEIAAPADEILTALRVLAGRYVALLESVFPDDTDRRAKLAAFVKG